ncbi:hypothetical protein [Mycobacterium sp. E2733]|uniref:hypothetical protein n=1 Tax=Mycobacterium sp. E2733 TaxID=1834138 RepID=UPI00080169B5|nr:hypothetical protein [Mycobacterium sp. E2733]OBI00395.1 hypothetical protein A5678_17975 [Mycobacterium sp. E2733]
MDGTVTVKVLHNLALHHGHVHLYWNQCWDTDNPPQHPPPPPFRQPNFNCGLFWCPVPPHP